MCVCFPFFLEGTLFVVRKDNQQEHSNHLSGSPPKKTLPCYVLGPSKFPQTCVIAPKFMGWSHFLVLGSLGPGTICLLFPGNLFLSRSPSSALLPVFWGRVPQIPLLK